MKRFWKWLKGLFKRTPSEPTSLEEAVTWALAQAHSHEATTVMLEVIEGSDTPSEFSTHVHHGLGRHIRNELLHKKPESPLRDWFSGIGLAHPDDISSLITDALYRRVQGKVLTEDEIRAHVEKCQAHWERMGGL